MVRPIRRNSDDEISRLERQAARGDLTAIRKLATYARASRPPETRKTADLSFLGEDNLPIQISLHKGDLELYLSNYHHRLGDAAPGELFVVLMRHLARAGTYRPQSADVLVRLHRRADLVAGPRDRSLAGVEVEIRDEQPGILRISDLEDLLNSEGLRVSYDRRRDVGTGAPLGRILTFDADVLVE